MMSSMTIHDEINLALDQLDQARQNFDYATPDFIDVAVAELAAAEARVDLFYRLAKEEAQSVNTAKEGRK